jgi:hypothetical protein
MTSRFRGTYQNRHDGADVNRLSTTALIGLAVFVAVATILINVPAGLPEPSQFGGHDTPFVIVTLAALHEAWWTAPGIPPGWLGMFYGGFGAPVLYFYPPLGFLIAQAFAAVGILDASDQLLAASTFVRLAGMLFCFLWLRCIVSRPTSLLGAAAYALFPYNALFNPIVRFAYAEVVASGLLPLVFLAIAKPNLGPRRRAAAVALALAMLGAVHVPSTLMAMVCGGAYALGYGWRRAVETVLGFALGLGLLAFHLVPALLLSAEVSTAALMDEGHSWRGTMLFWGSMATTSRLGLVWIMLYACFGLAATVAAATWFASPPRGVPARRAVMLGSVCALAFITPLSLPAWALLSPFDYVQFPWRFLVPASLFFAAQVALLSDRAQESRWPMAGRAVSLGVLLLAAIPPLVIGCIAVAKPEECIRFSAGPERTHRENGSGQAPEYLPKAAREAGWLPYIKRTETLPGVGPEPVVIAGDATVTEFLRDAGALRVVGRAAVRTDLRLPQFWFPGWSVTGTDGELTPDPATGLLRLTLPAGPFDIVVARQPLALTRVAALASLAMLVGVLALALWPFRPGVPARHRAGWTPAREVRAGVGTGPEP